MSNSWSVSFSTKCFSLLWVCMGVVCCCVCVTVCVSLCVCHCVCHCVHVCVMFAKGVCVHDNEYP